MGWKEADERLIRRGELILDLESLQNHHEELEEMNKGKRGPHYRIADTYIHLLSAIRYLYQMPYRQLEGFTRTLHVKLHFAVNTVTHEVVAMTVSTDDTHDVVALPGLVEESRWRGRVGMVLGDGAYDSSMVYALLEEVGVEAVIKPRRNARADRGHVSRRRVVEQVRRLGYECLGGAGWLWEALGYRDGIFVV